MPIRIQFSKRIHQTIKLWKLMCGKYEKNGTKPPNYMHEIQIHSSFFFVSFSFRFRLLNSTLTAIVLWRIRADYSYCFESVFFFKKKNYTKISISFIFLSLLCFSDCRLHDTNLYICSGWKRNERRKNCPFRARENAFF